MRKMIESLVKSEKNPGNLHGSLSSKWLLSDAVSILSEIEVVFFSHAAINRLPLLIQVWLNHSNIK